MVSEHVDDLIAQAHRAPVVVIGGGMAGLVAALECAKLGMPVTVLEAGSHWGGAIDEVILDGVRADVGPTCWSTRGGAVRALATELGMAEVIAAPREDRTWIAGLGANGAGAAPVPPATILGIPANTWDESVRPFLGAAGTWRAYLDRVRPPLTIGKEHSLGRLVRSRMGAAVLDNLVAPLSVGGFGIDPIDVDVSVAAPGLNSALTRTGSLGGAASELLVDAHPGPVVETIEGGLPRLVDALIGRLRELGVQLVLNAAVTSIDQADAGHLVHARSDDAETDAGPYAARAVIVATGEAAARTLLGLPAESRPPFVREAVTLVVASRDLDTPVRGTTVHAVPGRHRAATVSHDTARWDWAVREAGPGQHIVRVSFGSDGVLPATAELDDAAAAVLAREEASALLGVPLDESQVRGAHRARFVMARPGSAIGVAEERDAVRRALRRRAGIAVVGAWVAGGGLQQVVSDALAASEALRRSVLWTEAADGTAQELG